MSQPLISLLLPTRKRATLCIRAIHSALDHASDPSRLEIVLGIDEDDGESAIAIWQGVRERNPTISTVWFRRAGYGAFHVYNNALAQAATGRWLAIWNDDLLVQTPGFDDVIAKRSGRFALLDPYIVNANQPRFRHGLFPIVPRSWLRTLGHLSTNRHCDTYLTLIADALKCRVKFAEADLAVYHDRFDESGHNDDQTYRERAYATNDFYDNDTTLASINLDTRRLARAFGIWPGTVCRTPDSLTARRAFARPGAELP